MNFYLILYVILSIFIIIRTTNPGCKDPKTIRFKTFLHNTLLDTLKKRGWKETDE